MMHARLVCRPDALLWAPYRGKSRAFPFPLGCLEGAGPLDSPDPRGDPVRWAAALGERAAAQGRLVVLGARGDPFVAGPELAGLAGRALSAMLSTEARVEVVSRGEVPVAVAARAPGRVRVQIAVGSLTARAHEVYEPWAAPPRRRLALVRALRAAGVPVSVRIEPIVPLLGDTAGDLEDLLDAIALTGARAVTVAYLALRPSMERLLGELPPAHRALLHGSFAGRLHGRLRTLPPSLRRSGYERLRGLAAERGIGVSILACADPELGDAPCIIEPALGAPRVREGDLFAVS